MTLIPPIEILEDKYKDIMENEPVKSLSWWIETNSDDEFNEEEYLSKGLNSIDKFKQKMDEVLILRTVINLVFIQYCSRWAEALG